MPDMENVIGHLNDCMEASRRDNTWVFVRKDIVEDAIVLLKEQKAKTVIKIAKRFNDCDLTGFCPFCSRPLIKDWAENYCGYCGKPVLWKGR